MTPELAQPDPDIPHFVGRTTRVIGSGMHETGCSCGTVVHDIDPDASSAALEPHREIQRKRAAAGPDAPSFTQEGQ
jgi:hypothetical protein